MGLVCGGLVDRIHSSDMSLQTTQNGQCVSFGGREGRNGRGIECRALTGQFCSPTSPGSSEWSMLSLGGMKGGGGCG